MSSSKGKAPVSTSGISAYSKEDLGIMIMKLQDEKAQLIAVNKNLINMGRTVKTDKERLLKGKNTLVYKQDELREQLVAVKTRTVGPSVIPGKRTRKRGLKAKKPPP